MFRFKKKIFLGLVALLTTELTVALPADLDARIEKVLPSVVAWRRDFHEHPELSNQEFRTAKIVADHLRSLGMEVETEVAHTGVVGTLRGGDGPVVALRADMDALPVTELVDLPFASKAKGIYQGREVGVMHACGHDNHVAILMGVAEVLAGMGNELPGTVKFIFQPAEEGTPDGSVGGAELMLMEGAFENPRPDVVFGLHVFPFPAGTIATRPGGLMASSDRHQITIKGKQTHGAVPWAGVDPIVTASQVVLGLQTIVSRQLDATLTPSIVTVGRIEGGVRNNIIPESVELEGTIRTFDARRSSTSVLDVPRRTLRKPQAQRQMLLSTRLWCDTQRSHAVSADGADAGSGCGRSFHRAARAITQRLLDFANEVPGYFYFGRRPG